MKILFFCPEVKYFDREEIEFLAWFVFSFVRKLKVVTVVTVSATSSYFSPIKVEDKQTFFFYLLWFWSPKALNLLNKNDFLELNFKLFKETKSWKVSIKRFVCCNSNFLTNFNGFWSFGASSDDNYWTKSTKNMKLTIDFLFSVDFGPKDSNRRAKKIQNFKNR